MLVEGLAICVKACKVLFRVGKHHRYPVGKQHASLLEEFADRCGSRSSTKGSTTLRVCSRWRNRCTDVFRLLCLAVIRRDGATRKDVHIWHKITLDDPAYHEYFHLQSPPTGRWP